MSTRTRCRCSSNPCHSLLHAPGMVIPNAIIAERKSSCERERRIGLEPQNTILVALVFPSFDGDDVKVDDSTAGIMIPIRRFAPGTGRASTGQPMTQGTPDAMAPANCQRPTLLFP